MKEIKRQYQNIYIKYKVLQWIRNHGFAVWMLTFPFFMWTTGYLASIDSPIWILMLIPMSITAIVGFCGMVIDINKTYIEFLKQETKKAYKKREKREMKWLF